MALLGSCTEDLPEPLFTEGMIYGNVNINDFTSPPEDVKVLAMGPYGNQSSTTDQEGDYAIGGLGNGTYELEFSKEGYGTVKAFGIQVFGDDTLRRNAFLYELMDIRKLPDFLRVYTSDSHSWIQPDEIVISTDLGYSPQTVWGMRLFFARHPGVSYMDFDCTRNGRKLRRTGYANTLVTADNIPFEGGEEIYVIAYACNPDDMGYWDAYRGIQIFSTLDAEVHSQVLQFTKPEP
jgi:hypothetical protein